ncbi:molybdate ABC transporter substrate-binding protein [Alteromonas sediminis]|uniref:Molybdate ABC transporter substrate-binding protein n=1 Tax=Alteromonas sediminis TaxID=2259342 RepID=A0A3N5YCQ1_9ALTE|nr:molybdate ABC transporter substrate-binding protein [Alteromonas sediminis]RPJ67085.1 molybdate ABC transporter substrate-binding protein [Alteromonas sediminis]
MTSKFVVMLIVLFLNGFVSLVYAQTDDVPKVRIAVSANFYGPIKAMAPSLENACECSLSFTVGASGALAVQFAHGAPYDLFLSADKDKPEWLYQQGLTTAKPVTYAIGKLVLLDKYRSNLRFEDLAKPVQTLSGNPIKIAVANPKTAPYGVAAIEVIDRHTSHQQVQLVKGNNVMQAMQFFTTGAVDQAIVSASLVVAQPIYRDMAAEVPRSAYTALAQQAVVNISGQTELAEKLLAILLSAPMQETLSTLGYFPVQGEGI